MKGSKFVREESRWERRNNVVRKIFYEYSWNTKNY